MVAIAGTAVVERDEKESRALERAEPARRALVLEHGVAEGSAQRVEHGGPGEEAKIGGAEAREVLEVEVVGHEAIVPGGGVSVLRGERCEVDAGGPAFGALDERGQVGLGELDAEAAEQPRDVARREGKVVGPDLEEAPRGAQARERARRQGPSREHERRAGGDVGCERGDGPGGRLARRRVETVERPGRTAGRRRAPASPRPETQSASDTHVNGRSSRSAHCASTVVLP